MPGWGENSECFSHVICETCGSVTDNNSFLMGPMTAGNALVLISIDGYGWSHFLLTLIDLRWLLLQLRYSNSLIHISFFPTPSGLANVKPTSMQVPGSSIGYRSIPSTPDHADARFSLSVRLSSLENWQSTPCCKRSSGLLPTARLLAPWLAYTLK